LYTPLRRWLRHTSSEHFLAYGASFKSATQLWAVQIAADKHDPALPRFTGFPATDKVAAGNRLRCLEGKLR
jgi:hypothetical protein